MSGRQGGDELGEGRERNFGSDGNACLRNHCGFGYICL